MATRKAKPLASQSWKDEIRANLRGCDLHVVAYETYSRKHKSFFWNRFLCGEHPATVALDFAVHVGAI
ncbi:MAG: hypothetical protein ACYTGS_15635 [Planctomycetota bacterium]|jgi:hypothetical protein